MSTTAFKESYLARRTQYDLNDKVPISDEEITEIVRFYVENTPSSFNSQTTRAVVVTGEKSAKIWNEIAYNALKTALADKPEVFESQTAPKLQAFSKGHATILWFEDENKIKELQGAFPAYAAKFPEWAAHSSGAAQINTWAALALENVGGNLQHYSPLIDAGVEKEFNIPKGWKLTAQLVIGGVSNPANKPEHLDPKETVLLIN